MLSWSRGFDSFKVLLIAIFIYCLLLSSQSLAVKLKSLFESQLLMSQVQQVIFHLTRVKIEHIWVKLFDMTH